MKINKTILAGILFIIFAGILFMTDVLNPVIRPVTYLFLMGSSKGKDILFFGLTGLFLILSQVIKKDINTFKYLKISVVLGSVLLISGIFLEVIFRLQTGVGLNTVFCSMTNGMSSTSILHTHLLKSILGEVLSQIMGPFIQSDINTGVGLYVYLPSFAFLVVLLIPVMFVAMVLGSQKRSPLVSFLLAFFSSCLLIGIIDGGLFSTPSCVGIFGLYSIYRYGHYIDGIRAKDGDKVKKDKLSLTVQKNKIVYYFNRYLIIIAALAVIFLRLTIAFAGAEPDYYTVDVVNPAEDIDLGNISSEILNYEYNSSADKITYHIDSDYNEMDLINDLKIPLNNSCEYYTVSWNIYSYRMIL